MVIFNATLLLLMVVKVNLRICIRACIMSKSLRIIVSMTFLY